MKELSPIRESTKDWEDIEKKINYLFKTHFFYPLLNKLKLRYHFAIKNSFDDLLSSIQMGDVYYYRGNFYGKFNSKISKELRILGAIYNKSRKSYKIHEINLPYEVKIAISTADAKLDDNLKNIDKLLFDIYPAEFVNELNIIPNFSKVIKRTDKKIADSLKTVIIEPQVTESQSEIIAAEWENNLKLDIKKFTAEQTVKLRQQVKDNFYAGNRRENLIKIFQDSYNVTHNKAKFWARQETNLLLTTYKYTKYKDAGVNWYRWGCVKMPHQPTPKSPYKEGEVRFHHGIHEGKVFNLDNPPVTDSDGNRKNPGQDYNCRCFAIPLVNYHPYKT